MKLRLTAACIAVLAPFHTAHAQPLELDEAESAGEDVDAPLPIPEPPEEASDEDVVDAPDDAGEAPEGPEEPPRFTVSAVPGRGLTLGVGDVYSLTLRPRIQLRDTITVHPSRANEINVKTLRLWIQGHIFSPNTRYGIQLAMGGNDFENGANGLSASPIFDAYFEFTHARTASVRIGQFFVPFDRLRTIREFALQSVDRAVSIFELTLDRDVGVMLFSNDLLGDGGKLAYNLGLFGGEGRNRFGAQSLGFLYTARISYRPFGAFDEDMEGDLERSPRPRLMFGAAFAYNQNASRVRGTTGATLPLGTVDHVHFAVDTSLKWHGFAFLGELVLRGSPTATRTGMDAEGNDIMQTPARALAYVLQGSYTFLPKMELWARWNRIHLPWATDPALATLVAARGREVAGGLNYYVNGHAFKIQLDAQHAFGDDFGAGTTVVRVQLDATF